MADNHKNVLDFMKSFDVESKNIDRELSQSEKSIQKKIDKARAAQQLKYGEENEKALAKLREKLYKEQAKKEKEERQKNAKEIAELEGNFAKANAIKAGQAIAGAINTAVGKFAGSVDSAMGTFSQYMQSVSTRLQGAGLDYWTMAGDIKSNIGMSPLIKQSEMISNLNELVKRGVALNTEMRAWVATVSTGIANTFDAFDSSLLRLIRIQQQDSTATRLGLEVQLTRFLNQNFRDTSYLGGLQRQVSSALLGAESGMGAMEAVGFESTVQHWLGAMSSAGVGESLITSLASGIGALGTGDVSFLSSNTGIRNLLMMATGGGAASLLSGGVTAEDASQLLNAVVRYGQSIASETNNVVKAQYAAMFGMTVADLNSMLNLTADRLQALTEASTTAQSAQSALTASLGTMSSRISMKQKFDTALDNLMSTVGESIASSPISYGIWQTANLLDQYAGGLEIPVPFIGNIKTSNVLKAGLMGGGLVSSIGSLAGGLFGSQGIDINAWGGFNQDFTGRTQVRSLPSGFESAVSGSGYISDMGDIYNQTLTSQAQQLAENERMVEESADEKLTTSVIRDNTTAILAFLNNQLETKISSAIQFANVTRG